MNILYVFVEGPDDSRFFEWYFKFPIIPFLYAREKASKINKFIEAIDKMPFADYVFTADLDNKSFHEKIKCLNSTFFACDDKKIILVKKQIEGWYLAGLSPDNCQKLYLKNLNNTESITKEQFNKCIPKKYSRVEFMLEVLNLFSCEEAIIKNKSFNDFHIYAKNSLSSYVNR